MKIGIITFHRAVNYGAILQAYALQQALNKLGVDNEIIDYRCRHIEDAYSLFDIKKIKSLRNLIHIVLYDPVNKIKSNKFKKFIEQNIKMSSKIETKNDLNEINMNYEAFITGSDQVWNNKCTGFDKAYFLDFVKDDTKKNSYAASFGTNCIIEELEEDYRKLLGKFNNISIREKQGQEILRELINIDVPVHLDPTFLLTKEEWLNVVKDTSNKDKYILVYLMQYSPSIIKFAENLSKSSGYKIIHINNEIIKKAKGKYIRTSGPEEFLGLFAGAEYIVTNSFHGTAFSINFNKNFFVELLPPPAKVNSRLENIMDLLNLRDRQIVNGKNINIDKSIDYNKVNAKIAEEREVAKSYLREILGVSNE
ncbi:MAG: polysaccharide pyruvyl transferase family protein [Zhenhengia sp.]|uniref:polysaccharide pyruvyl transferase family protein n=1 Tax=Zhenhengia sp. TaxID=2944208 RepID=UPI003995A842